MRVATEPTRSEARRTMLLRAEPVPTLLAGRYRLDELIGQGGMSFVYAATHLGLGSRVAVKVLRPKFRDHEEIVERFLREARAAVRVRHPNVVEIRDFGTAETGEVFTVMEFLSGETLESTLHREGALAWARVGHIATQLCAALGAAHAADIVHRDVTLGNVFRTRLDTDADFVKLVDFGIARVLEPEADAVAAPRLTSEVEVFGTPAFMAPEQVRRSLDADPRSDVYSLGVVMFALATGRLPFAGRTTTHVLSQQLHEAPPRPRSLRPRLDAAAEAVILRALEKDPADRFASMAELAAAIAAVPAEPPVTPPTAPRRPTGARRAWPLALGALALVAALVLALW